MKPKQEIENDDVDCDGLLGFDETTSGFNASNNHNNSSNTTFASNNNAPQYFRWTPESTKMMLTMRFNMETHFSQRLRQKKDLWNEIATEMGRLGDYLITGEACDLKFRNMLQTFKKNRIKEERGMNDLIIWEYYTLFKEAMRNTGGQNDSDASANEPLIPSMLCESLVYNGEDTNNEIPQSSSTDKIITTSADGQKMGVQKSSIYNEQSLDSPKQPKRPRLHSAQSQTDHEQFVSKNVTALRQTKATQFDQHSAQSHLPIETPITPESSYQTREPMQFPLSNVEHTSMTGWLAPTEFSECEVFGQGVGLQLANVRDPYSRTLLKLKIQQLFFLANTGKLSESPNLI